MEEQFQKTHGLELLHMFSSLLSCLVTLAFFGCWRNFQIMLTITIQHIILYLCWKFQCITTSKRKRAGCYESQPEFLHLPHEEDEFSSLLAIMIPVWHIVYSISTLRGILCSSHVFHKFIVCSIYQHRRLYTAPSLLGCSHLQWTIFKLNILNCLSFNPSFAYASYSDSAAKVFWRQNTI